MRTLYLALFFSSALTVCQAQSAVREKNIELQMLIKSLGFASGPRQVLYLTEKVLNLDSTNTIAIANRALAFRRLRDYDAALNEFNRYFKYKPKSTFVIYRAEFLAAMGNKTAAIKDLESALVYSGYSDIITEALCNFYKTLSNDSLVESVCHKVLARHPNNWPSYYMLGDISESRNNYKAASEYYAKALKVSDDLSTRTRYETRFLYHLKAQADIKTGNHSEAIKALSEAILLAPNNYILYRHRASSYILNGEKQKACPDVKWLEEHDEFYSKENLDCDFKSETSFFTKEWLKEVEAERLCRESDSLAMKGEEGFDAAINCLTKSLALKANNVYALTNRASIYATFKEPEKAIADLDEVIRIRPDAAAIFHYRAALKNQIGNTKGAIQDEAKAVMFDSTNVKYIVWLAMYEGLVGDNEAALNNLSKAISLDGFNMNAYFERGALLLDSKKDYASALADLLKAIEILENLPLNRMRSDYYFYCAMAYDKLGDYKKAQSMIETAISLDPSKSGYYFFSGEVKARLKDLAGSCTDWNISKQLGNQRAEEVIKYNCK